MPVSVTFSRRGPNVAGDEGAFGNFFLVPRTHPCRDSRERQEGCGLPSGAHVVAAQRGERWQPDDKYARRGWHGRTRARTEAGRNVLPTLIGGENESGGARFELCMDHAPKQACYRSLLVKIFVAD